ncbi:MAG TPA: ABC transporter permease [Clostridiaceae bacterium]|jgi:ABC-2 type transport system permease protein|nr:ABC transporter permease [Clostridiaceae bacterium]
MATFKAYIKKEYIESIRQFKYIILAVGIIGFAILDPIMLKILPKLLENQLPQDLSSLMIFTPKSVVNNYIKDLCQIGTLVVIFTLCNILSEEKVSEKFVFPYSKGSSPAGIVLAKCIYYTIMITLFIFIGFITVYYYGGILFKGERVDLIDIFKSAFLMSIYFFFIITLLIFLSSIVKKGAISGFLTLLIIFLLNCFNRVQSIGKFLPNKLIQNANLFTLNDTAQTITFAILYSTAFIIFTIMKMSKTEVI